MFLRNALSASLAIALASVLPAHGGQYRGNPDAPGGSPPPPDARTGGRPISPTSVQWQTWWEFNKDGFLRQRTVSDANGPVTGGDDFFLGASRRADQVDLLKPTDTELQDIVVPALAAMFKRERNRDIVGACLIALGKVGRDGPGVDLEATLAEQIRRDDQEVRESAVLALGIAGRDRALPQLMALARDTREGRRLEDRLENVSWRTRAFAIFGLGLLARRSSDPKVVQEVADTCLELARERKLGRELRVAALSSLGILAPAGKSGTKRLAWSIADELVQMYQSKVGPAEEMTHSHAAVAIARLLGRGAGETRRRCKQAFADELTARSPRGSALLRSAVIALGAMTVPAAEDKEDAVFSKVLQQVSEKAADRHVRLFALISLGRIGGEANREFLIEAYRSANRLTVRPWAALALGLLTSDAGNRGEVDVEVAKLLLADLDGGSEDTLRGALAVAIGLTGYADAVPEMLRVLGENEREQMSAGYLCVGLGLLSDREAIEPLSEILDRSARRPFLMQHCAVALGLLGDRDASKRLLAKMEASTSLAVLASLATAIGRIGDRRSIEPLIALMNDPERTKLARAFVAAALGGIGDKDSLPWNMPFSRDCNYASPTSTLTNGRTGVLDIL